MTKRKAEPWDFEHPDGPVRTQRTAKDPPPPEPWRQWTAENHEKVRGMIGVVLQKLATMDIQAKAEQYGEGARNPAVRWHWGRLMARGLEEGVAYMQAKALVADAAHVAQCGVCQADKERR